MCRVQSVTYVVDQCGAGAFFDDMLFLSILLEDKQLVHQSVGYHLVIDRALTSTFFFMSKEIIQKNWLGSTFGSGQFL